jgi:hypothetical protein
MTAEQLDQTNYSFDQQEAINQATRLESAKRNAQGNLRSENAARKRPERECGVIKSRPERLRGTVSGKKAKRQTTSLTYRSRGLARPLTDRVSCLLSLCDPKARLPY